MSRHRLNRVRDQGCLITGVTGGNHAHHLTFVDCRGGMGLKKPGYWAVPQCPEEHIDLHRFTGGEKEWWQSKGVDPVAWAKEFHKRN